MLDFPASFFLSFLDNHGLLTVNNQFPWRVIEGGSERYVEALSRPFRDRIRLKTPVRGIRRHPHHVELKTAAGPTETYDQVIVDSGCHPLPAKRGGASHRHLGTAQEWPRLGELELPDIA
jgi:predicted NAD/FAD-binding protein